MTNDKITHLRIYNRSNKNYFCLEVFQRIKNSLIEINGIGRLVKLSSNYNDSVSNKNFEVFQNFIIIIHFLNLI